MVVMARPGGVQVGLNGVQGCGRFGFDDQSVDAPGAHPEAICKRRDDRPRATTTGSAAARHAVHRDVERSTERSFQ